MECVVTDYSVHEAAVDVTAETPGGRPVRFQLPHSLLGWSAGHRFLCRFSDEPNAVCTLSGVVVACSGDSVLLSHGGLPFQVPREALDAGVGDAVCTSLLDAGRKRTRSLRDRGGAAGRAT